MRRLLVSTLFGMVATAASAAPLTDLPTLSANHGVLDILMVARAAPLRSLTQPAPDGWVYDICPRPAGNATTCPPTSANLYGGTRLALKGGDVLKVRLVNKLPPAPEAKHASEAPYLASNPTNLHTHGLLVSPRYPTLADPTYGDSVFVLTLNPANMPLPSAADGRHIHSDLRLGYTDYRIEIPAGHPSGLFWFHPHAHGIALNQVSAGLAGMITVGDVSDYVCPQDACESYASTIPVRHLLLKDTQMIPGAGGGLSLMDQEDPQFCFQQRQPDEINPRRGSCPGAPTPVSADPEDPSTAYPGGRWFFSVNGQVFPTIAMTGAQGEIWRIASASGSASYDLRLQDAFGKDMVVQILSIDGVGIGGPDDASVDEWSRRVGNKVAFVPCPGVPKYGRYSAWRGKPVCATRIVMMPSSRVEVWVAYRDATGALVSAPPSGATATWKTVGFGTGGDDWPAIDLADIRFSGQRRPRDPVALTIGGTAAETLEDPRIVAAQLKAANEAVGPDASCRPLKSGHGRRIFFASVDAPDGSEGFGLGYEEIDAFGIAVPGTYVAPQRFDPQNASICLPLAAGDKPMTEVWQLVNLTDEDHNFHMHQLRFFLLRDPSVTDTLATLKTLDGDEVAHDNLPVRHGAVACESVDAWRAARNPASPAYRSCDGKPVHVAIPFSIAGDYVYHCHILEHEDGGMMAVIRVRAAPNKS